MQFLNTEATEHRSGISFSGSDDDLLDSYSRTVSTVAAAVSAGVVRVDVIAANGRRAGTGSGFVFTPDGYIITNSHVVHGGTRFVVQTSEGESYAGFKVGDDPHTDLALLSIEAPRLT